MAGYGWNSNNLPTSTYTGAPQIACRICNQVFVSTEAFLHHIEIHMSTDHDVSSVSASRRMQQPPPSLNASGGGLSRLSGQRNNFSFPIPNVYSTMFNPNPNQFIHPRAAPDMYSPFPTVRNNYGFGSQSFPIPFQAPRKFTQPFLQQLEKPLIPISDSDSEFEVLDLNLKL